MSLVVSAVMAVASCLISVFDLNFVEKNTLINTQNEEEKVKIGDDQFGQMAKEIYDKSGVDYSRVITSKEHSTGAAGDDRGRMGPHRQYLLVGQRYAQREHDSLRHDQGGGDRIYPALLGSARQTQHPRQLRGARPDGYRHRSRSKPRHDRRTDRRDADGPHGRPGRNCRGGQISAL